MATLDGLGASLRGVGLSSHLHRSGRYRNTLNLQEPSHSRVSGHGSQPKRTERGPKGFGIALFKLQHEGIMMEKC